MDKREFVDLLMERASKAGFEAYQASCSSGDSFSVAVSGGTIIVYNVASSRSVGLKAIVGGKAGRASTQAFDAEAAERMIAAARENAELIESDDEEFIYAGDGEYPAVEALNGAPEKLSAADKIEMVRAFEREVTSLDPRVKRAEYAELSTEISESRIVNSKGLDVSFISNVCDMGASALAEKDGEASNAGRAEFARDFAAIDVKALAAQIVREAADGLEAKPVKSGSYRVALRNDAAGSILACFSSIFSSERAQKGLSLLAGREGQIIASPALTIIDDPLDAALLGARPFDSEGVAGKRREIVTAGRLNTLLYNLKTAKKAGAASTGHAAGGDVCPSNFYIAPSGESFEALLSRMGDGLLITSLTGLHSGANQISGDFSLGAKGYLVEGGKLSRAVKQITVAGNFFKLLESVELAASDLRMGYPGASCIGSPTLLIPALSVAGL